MKLETFIFAYLRSIVALIIALMIVFALLNFGDRLPVVGGFIKKVGALASGQQYQFNG